VVSASEHKAVIVDLTDMQPAGEVAFNGTPGPAVVTADGLKMYVALTDTNGLAVVDVQHGKVLKTLANVGQAPSGVTMALTNNYCH
jgi:DNA-binding beta-propeller fold protein YncE